MDTRHEIFRKPFRVEPTFEEIDTPENYRKYFDGKDLPKKTKAWRVQKELRERNYGLVSDGWGFLDTPDCEYISGGKNQKGPSSMALGRQGNWFLWGFCAAPEEMTDEARKVFLNTVAYMKRFDGRKPVGTKEQFPREWAMQYATYLEHENESIRNYGLKAFTPELLEIVGKKTDRLQAMLRADFEYLYPVKPNQWGVDADCKALGIPNRDVKLLDACVALLETGEDTERARRVLKRYTVVDFKTAAKWRDWLNKHRDRLYFTDTGGFKFRHP